MAYPYRGKIVYTDCDEDGVIDVVDESSSLRSLQFGSQAKQSTMFLRSPASLALAYTQCLMTSLLFNPDPKQVLVLGLGGGSVPKFILDIFPACHVDVVEKRAKIVEVARRYFAVPDEVRLNITVSDGLGFLLYQHFDDLYDLIVVDLHESHRMAPVVLKSDFFPACHACLEENGMLAINLWYGNDEQAEREVRSRLESIYPERVLYLPVAGKRNCIALAFDANFSDSRETLERRARHLRDKTGVAFPDLLLELYRHNPTCF